MRATEEFCTGGGGEVRSTLNLIRWAPVDWKRSAPVVAELNLGPTSATTFTGNLSSSTDSRIRLQCRCLLGHVSCAVSFRFN
ncbi:hypothetical protein R1flu_004840 [Riccia fluitans]|uniref:Uncharacterized protein n=1 Tax=Riccia fluitans TaxID=41844 RepID=A0ABD1YRF7_9MARC